MQKGKFGFSLWLYPFISLWMILVGPDLASLLILGFVIAAERDEWTIRQCAHVVMFNIYWGLLTYVLSIPGEMMSGVPFVGPVLALPFAIIETIVWIVVVILIFVNGLGKLKNGQSIALPGKGIVNRVFDVMQQNFTQNHPPQGYPQAQGYQPPQGYAPPPPSQGGYPPSPPQGYSQAQGYPPPPPPQGYSQQPPYAQGSDQTNLPPSGV